MNEKSSPSGVKPPGTVRQLQTSAALSLRDLAAIFEDMTTVVDCCEQILVRLTRSEAGLSDITVEALWTTALISYRRCFVPGPRGMGLTEEDVEATGMRGEVVEWHKLLEKLGAHHVDAGATSRETFVVGISQDSGGNANGVAITSAPRPRLDETTVRQTGHLALELSRLVDERINSHQETVYNAARAMTADALSSLPVVPVAGSESADSGSPE
ncbi:hypothetical protein [Halopolyspora algeriensis]|nr:hypothetical protein [Halopolyspora algeriensis]